MGLIFFRLFLRDRIECCREIDIGQRDGAGSVQVADQTSDQTGNASRGDAALKIQDGWIYGWIGGWTERREDGSKGEDG